MRLVTYVHRSLYDSLMSQDVTHINNTKLVLWDKIHGDSNGIPCLAGAPENRCMSYLTVVEFYPDTQMDTKYFVDAEWILLELEVPEDDITQIRPRDELAFTCVDGSDAGYPRRNVRIFNDKMRWLRDYCKESRCGKFRNEAAWAILDCIKREWIVSVREFLYFSKEYWTTKYCHILYMDCRKFPLWRESCYVDFKTRKMLSWMRDSSAPRMEDYCQDYDKIIAYLNLAGMHGCPGYFTVNEAMTCCDYVTKEVISAAIKRKRLGNRPKDSILIQDLFGGDLVKVDNISDEKLRLLGNVFTNGVTRESIRSTYSDEDIKTIYKYILGYDQLVTDADVMIDILLDTANIYC